MVFFPDGSTLVAPDLQALATRVGLRTAVVEMEVPGRQAGMSARIENYLGFPNGISGADLARRAVTQARRLGVEILVARTVVALRLEDEYKVATLDDGGELRSHAVVLATGVRVRTLDVPGVERLLGASVYHGAASAEAVNYTGKRVVAVGGANSAGQGAMFLSRCAAEVLVLVRGDLLTRTMSRYLIDQIEATDRITVRTRVEVAAMTGTDHLETLTVRDPDTGEEESIETDAVFVFIGAVPCSTVLQGAWRPYRDPFVQETSVPGIFAAGDVRHGVIRRVASAVVQGWVAVSLVRQYSRRSEHPPGRGRHYGSATGCGSPVAGARHSSSSRISVAAS